ncbi:hypothetical protein CHS0354_033959 [Potamilus streckersoni]|uniref:Uncharacterized protein n=1 Tax=Potamilus streckersoni TaxID=2493646 RepID=A0AAE0T8F3_9BIVA|nr:hypothetical protein CHS0354_033959 [Potamilus streckersoni]
MNNEANMSRQEFWLISRKECNLKTSRKEWDSEIALISLVFKLPWVQFSVVYDIYSRSNVLDGANIDKFYQNLQLE